MTKRYYARAALGKVVTCHICLQAVANELWFVDGLTTLGLKAKMCASCFKDYSIPNYNYKKIDSITFRPYKEVVRG